MSVPKIYREFFYQVNQVESRVKLWPEDDYFNDMSSPEVPLVSRDENLTFGEFMTQIYGIARKYRCSIFSSSEDSCAISISAQEAYGLAMHMFY